MATLKVTHMGEAGVNVDKNPLELGDNELTKAQNAVADVAAGTSSLRKRRGFIAFNLTAITEGAVLGGTDLPIKNASSGGVRNLYVGRGLA